MSSWVDAQTLSAALKQLHGTANEFFRIWLTLKFMGLAADHAPVQVTTSNSKDALTRLFGFHSPDQSLFYPLATSPRWKTMKHDAHRSIIQTNVRRWATSGSVVTCDPTSYIDFTDSAEGLLVSIGRRYPLGLGHGESGFAPEENARLSIPESAWAVWYGRETEIPAGRRAVEYLTEVMRRDLNISTEEAALVFSTDKLDVTTTGTPLAPAEIYGLVSRHIEGQPGEGARVVQEDTTEYEARVTAVAGDLTVPQWLRTPAHITIQSAISAGATAVLLYGPPRTGKTRTALSALPGAKRIQLHDGWGYSELIMGLHMDPQVGTDWRAGALVKAVRDGQRQIILEEINRTLFSQALGDIFSLLEETYRGEEHALTLPDGSDFFLPRDLVVLMTMNTVDQSTEDIDDALLGRVAAVECPPDGRALKEILDERSLDPETVSAIQRIFVEINRHYPLGHGYYASLPNGGDKSSVLLHYQTRVRPVLQSALGELRRDRLTEVDGLVDQLLG